MSSTPVPNCNTTAPTPVQQQHHFHQQQQLQQNAMKMNNNNNKHNNSNTNSNVNSNLTTPKNNNNNNNNNTAAATSSPTNSTATNRQRAVLRNSGTSSPPLPDGSSNLTRSPQMIHEEIHHLRNIAKSGKPKLHPILNMAMHSLTSSPKSNPRSSPGAGGGGQYTNTTNNTTAATSPANTHTTGGGLDTRSNAAITPSSMTPGAYSPKSAHDISETPRPAHLLINLTPASQQLKKSDERRNSGNSNNTNDENNDDYVPPALQKNINIMNIEGNFLENSQNSNSNNSHSNNPNVHSGSNNLPHHLEPRRNSGGAGGMAGSTSVVIPIMGPGITPTNNNNKHLVEQQQRQCTDAEMDVAEHSATAFQNFSFNKPPTAPVSPYQQQQHQQFKRNSNPSPNKDLSITSSNITTPKSVSPQALKAMMMRRRSSGDSVPNSSMTGDTNNNNSKNINNSGGAQQPGGSQQRRGSNDINNNNNDGTAPLIHLEVGDDTNTRSAQTNPLTPQAGGSNNIARAGFSMSSAGGISLPPGLFKRLPGGWIADGSIAPLVNSLTNDDVLTLSTSNHPFHLSGHNISFGAAAATSFGASLRQQQSTTTPQQQQQGQQGGRLGMPRNESENDLLHNASRNTTPGFNRSTTNNPNGNVNAANQDNNNPNSNNANNNTTAPVFDPSQQYQIKKNLGKGSFSKVFLVRDVNNGNYFVNKIMEWKPVEGEHPNEAKSRYRLAQRDVELISNCAHPNIVQYIDSYETDTATHVILEHVAGGDLSRELDNRRQMGRLLRVEVALRFWVQIALALDYLHEHDIVHRDVKPANIIICNSPEGFVKLADFGFAARTFEERGEQFGSPFWAAPEMFHAVDHSTKCDVWSAGVLLYELLSLRLPFPGNNTTAHAATRERCDFPSLPPHVPAEIKQAVSDMLKYNEKERPTLRELLSKNSVLRGALTDLMAAIKISPAVSETMKEVGVAHICDILGIELAFEDEENKKLARQEEKNRLKMIKLQQQQQQQQGAQQQQPQLVTPQAVRVAAENQQQQQLQLQQYGGDLMSPLVPPAAVERKYS